MRWNHHPELDAEATRLAHRFDVHPLTMRVMLNRGIRDEDEVQRFLVSDLGQLRDPFLFKDMDRAVARIRQALVNRERVHIHGDYDVDGLSATSILLLTLRRLGADVHYSIAQRGDSVVGLSVEALQRDHLPHRPDLILTADCGSTNGDAIDAARSHGVDVIVVDHHQLGSERPDCVALLNPHQPGCEYPFKSLAAVGVAYHFSRALEAFLQADDEHHWPPLPLAEYMDIVALGTVADVVPILDDNRIFVREGLRLICTARRPGICALMRSARIIQEGRNDSWVERVNARTIGYRIAPLINAAGRMGDASRCVELLTTDTYRVAVRIGEELVALNSERQRCEREILQEASELADLACERGDEVIVLAQPHWHPGVLGIVASRLVERLNRPAIVASIDAQGVARGSVRSPDRINMLDALNACGELLETWGGHPLAAGLQVREENWEAFVIRVNEVIRGDLPASGRPDRRIDVDAIVDLKHLDEAFLRQIALLAPFGVGNPEPILEARNVQPMQARMQNGTLRVRLRQGGQIAMATGYGLARAMSLLREPVDVLFSPRAPREDGSMGMAITLHDVKATQR